MEGITNYNIDLMGLLFIFNFYIIQLLLRVLPPKRQDRPQILRSQRLSYVEFVRDLIINGQPSDQPVDPSAPIDDPLSASTVCNDHV